MASGKAPLCILTEGVVTPASCPLDKLLINFDTLTIMSVLLNAAMEARPCLGWTTPLWDRGASLVYVSLDYSYLAHY